MVIMSRDGVEAPPTQRLYQRRPRAVTPTRYTSVGNRHDGNPIEPLPLSLPPATEDTYLLQSVDNKKDVMVYVDDDARVHRKLFTACPSSSVATNLRSTSFCLIPPTPPLSAKRQSTDRQSSVESAPPSMRVGASVDLLSPSTVDGHLEETTPPETPDDSDRRVPPSSSCPRRGLYWAAVSDASETSDQPPSNWASFDLSLSDCPLRLPPSDTNCDLTIASVDSLALPTSESAAALSVEEFDPLSCAPTNTTAQKTVRCPSSTMWAVRSLGNVVDGSSGQTSTDVHPWTAARRLPPPPPSALLGRRVRQASASIGNDGTRLLLMPSGSLLSPLDDRTISVTAVYGDESTLVSPTTTVSGTRSTASTPQTSRQSSHKNRRATTTAGVDSPTDEHNCRTSGCRRIRINVSGQRFETRLRVLDRHPLTLLGDVVRRRQFYDTERRELFFDRHRPSFEAIFAYYQNGGRLRRPYHVPDDVFLAELEFYELENEAIEEYKRSEGHVFEVTPMPSNPYLCRLWKLFEHPDTSRAAFCIAILSVVMTLISIVLFCVETLPTFALTHCVKDEAPNFLDPFFVIETTCTAWFTLEAIVRFIACPSKIDFWKDFKNIVDVMAVVPYYVTLFNVLSTMSCASAKSSASLSFLRVIRLVRVFKLTKHSVGLQVLVLTFKASLEGLGLFLVALLVSLLVFSSAIYYAELGRDNSQMYSIPDAFWWAIITMTTVGYGDKVPVGPTGRLIGAACAITGVLTLAIPVPIITGHFNRFYAHKTGRGRHA